MEDMRIMGPAKSVCSRHVHVKKGKMLVADYNQRAFDEIPVTLVNWEGPIPENVTVLEEYDEKIIIPIAEMYKHRITD